MKKLKKKYSFCTLDFSENLCHEPMIFIDLNGGSYDIVARDKKSLEKAIAELEDMVKQVKKFGKEMFKE